MTVQRAVVGVTVVMRLIATPVYAQTAQSLPPPSDTRFLAVDFTGGVLQFSNQYETAGVGDGRGWYVGATIRPQTWWGITGEVARTTTRDDAHRAVHYLGGVRVNTTSGGEFATRLFAHALVGGTNVHDLTGSHAGTQFVTGAGFDFLYFVRVQGDYVLSNVTGLTKNHGRVLVGVVLPLCFKGCRKEGIDGIPLSRHTSRK
jgi:hypothetical protein